MAQTAKKPCSRGLALAKFLIFSGLGIFMFFVNVEINGKNVIIIQHIINFVKATCGPVIPYYALAMVAFGAVSPIITKAYKRSTFDLVFTIAKAFGLVIGLMAITGIGPAALMTDDTLDEWDEIIHESRHTRYPVCDGSTDNVIGILNAKDYFRIADRTKEKVLEEAVHPAYFVPETIKADVLFRDMKNTRNSLAVVLDEYGGMVGIIPLNDLIEELVGELNDEPADPENEDPHIEKIDDTSWRVIGNVELCDLEEETGVELASDDYDTLTGLVFDKLGMIPVDGPQNITIELDKLTVHIDKIESHQIDSAVITLKPSEEMDENEE